MSKYKLKKPALYAIGASSILLLVVGSVISQNSYLTVEDMNEPDYDYVTETILEEKIPTIDTSTTIIKPYNDTNVTILRDYYDYTSEKEKQEKSIIYYESTYMQNSSVAYGGVDSFDIVAILDGTVSSIKEDEMLGNIIEIEHENNIISVYQSVSEIAVKENQVIKQGDIIAKSGTSSINSDLNSHLLFELIVDSQIVNPEQYFNKNINDL